MRILRQLRPLSLLALVALGACNIDSATSPFGSSLAARKPRNPPPPPPPAPLHDPILFVHGWNASSATFSTMASRFKADGWTDAEIVNWSYNYRQSNATTAAQIKAKVDSILTVTGATHVDIITHSMGTLSARYYIRNLGGDGKVDALVSLGGANHGTNTAFFCVDTSCVEMRPNSTFVSNLNSIDETWGTTTRYATWWTSCDTVINPTSSTALNGALNTQTACMDHSALHEDATVYGQVKSWILPPLP